MNMFKFSDRVVTREGEKGIVQEDQEPGSDEVKIMLEGEDMARIYTADILEKDETTQQ